MFEEVYCKKLPLRRQRLPRPKLEEEHASNGGLARFILAVCFFFCLVAQYQERPKRHNKMGKRDVKLSNVDQHRRKIGRYENKRVRAISLYLLRNDE